MMITLKAARVNAGLSQDEAAEAIGVNKSTLANYEQGKTFPTASKIRKIEEVYKVSYSDIFFSVQNTVKP